MANIQNGVLTGITHNDITFFGTYRVPDGVTSIGFIALYGCKRLTSIALPVGVTSIGGQAFEMTSLRFITLPEGVTSIGVCAFYCCKNLTSIIMPNSLTSIGFAALYGCKRLTSITLPEGLTSIEKETFFNCKSLKSITIPKKVASIGNKAFDGCDSLTYIITDESNVETLRRLLPDRLKQKIATKKLVQKIENIKEKHLECVLQDASVNPLFFSSKGLKDKDGNTIEMLSELPEDLWYEINKQLRDDLPIYRKVKAEMDKLPLPRSDEELNDYDEKCKEILTVFKDTQRQVTIRLTNRHTKEAKPSDTTVKQSASLKRARVTSFFNDRDAGDEPKIKKARVDTNSL